MYKVMFIASLLTRQFLLPNPFEPLGDSFAVAGMVLSPLFLNLLAEPILHVASFGAAGIFYRGGAAEEGSFFYLVFYMVHVGIIYAMSLAHFAWWAMALILAAYIAAIGVFYTSQQ